MASRERDHEADLESGGTTSEEESGGDSVSSHIQGKTITSRLRSGTLSLDGSRNGEFGTHLGADSSALSRYNASESIELLVEQCSGSEENDALVIEKTNLKEKKKKLHSKKPPKPPRPPNGPSLNASDLKLMKEISELAAKKRARIERMKALRKMKAPKRSSSSSSLTAMVISVIFFIIILFQGFCSRSSFRVGFHGSPEAALDTEGLISMKFYGSPSNETSGNISRSPRSAEQASGSARRC
ncbi:hypothetical protein Dimus_016718 [Dionaea muscipula]